MISKKVVTETIPTFYNDKTDYENSSENFSIGNTQTMTPSYTTRINNNRPQTSKMKPSIKSVNYLGYRFNDNLNRSNLNNSVIFHF